jgi:hypothetical protein
LALLALRLKMLLLGVLRLPNLRFFLPALSLLLHLLLMSLNLRPLLILLLPLMSQFLSLWLRSRLIALDAPGPPPFPVSIILPALPVLSKPWLGNRLIVPPVSVPIMVTVVSPPAGVYIKIKARNSVVIGPTPIVIA